MKIDKEQVAAHTGDFSFEIKEVTRHANAELNQELFDKVFGKDVVTSEEEFKNKIREALAEQFTPQSEFKFLTDARDLLVQKAGELSFADDLLKRWLLAADEKNTKEKIDEEYPHIVEDLTYQLIREKLVVDNGLKVENADLEDFAKRVAKAQFAQYGMLSVPESRGCSLRVRLSQSMDRRTHVLRSQAAFIGSASSLGAFVRYLIMLSCMISSASGTDAVIRKAILNSFLL